MLLVLLFFALALAFSVFYFIKHNIALSIIGGFLWFLFVVYVYPLSAGWDVYRGFAAIGGLMAFISWILPLAWRVKIEEEEEEPYDYYGDIANQRNEIRGTLRKMRGEKIEGEEE
jgi:hypothetical protein